MPSEPQPDAPWGGTNPFMPDRSAGVLESLDFTDIIEEIKYRIRRYEIKESEKQGKRIKEWKPPEPIKIKEKVIKYIDTGLLDAEGNPVTQAQEVEEEVTYTIPPLLNRKGEHDILALVTPFMSRNVALSNIPQTKNGTEAIEYIYRTCKEIGEMLIDLLMYNYIEYEIKSPNHMDEIYEIVMVSIEFALRQAVNNLGREYVCHTLGETRTIIDKSGVGNPEQFIQR